jgi:hypothetical protein
MSGLRAHSRDTSQHSTLQPLRGIRISRIHAVPGDEGNQVATPVNQALLLLRVRRHRSRPMCACMYCMRQRLEGGQRAGGGTLHTESLASLDALSWINVAMISNAILAVIQ